MDRTGPDREFLRLDLPMDPVQSDLLDRIRGQIRSGPSSVYTGGQEKGNDELIFETGVEDRGAFRRALD